MGSTKKMYRERKAEGICQSCSNDAMPGNVRCGGCLERIAAEQRVRAKSRAKAKLCVRGCGRPVFQQSAHRCLTCLIEHRAYAREYMRKRRSANAA